VSCQKKDNLNQEIWSWSNVHLFRDNEEYQILTMKKESEVY
jgi:hypothetical protein